MFSKSVESEISPTGNRDSGISVRLMEEDRMDILRKQERDISSPPFQKFLKGTGCIFGCSLSKSDLDVVSPVNVCFTS